MISMQKHCSVLTRRRQQGVSLLIVMVVMLLSLLLVLGSSRLGVLNEKMAGNTTDYQRAYEAAEALLSDAELDLACLQGVCPARATQLTCKTAEFTALEATLSALTPPCQNGICLDLGTAVSGDPATSFWNSATNGATPSWATMTSGDRGAKFGQYTNTTITAGNAVNPLLLNNAWYWIEVLPYGSSGANGRSVNAEQSRAGGRMIGPDTGSSGCSYVFRVTAAAQGRKTGTTAVLQSLHFFMTTN